MTLHFVTNLNKVESVAKPATLLLLAPKNDQGLSEQFSQEGYNVVHRIYPTEEDFSFKLGEVAMEITRLGSDWGMLWYGLANSADFKHALSQLPVETLRACVQYSPAVEKGAELLVKNEKNEYIPTTVHLASSQEHLQASLLPYTVAETLGYPLATSQRVPITVHAYPFVPASPPFALVLKAPTLATVNPETVDPHIRSATGISHTRTLSLLKEHLGPHFNLEALWEKHTHFEFVERDAKKTMSTMVAAPYVNHVATMTGGVGHDELFRFYKHHFTGVTPPDAEMINVSRTVGADKIIDEMIFKCTHSMEIDYFLPGIAPTGLPLEIALVGIVSFRGDKIFFEHLHWDQASLLVQVGLLDRKDLPVAGAEVAHKVLDPFGQPSNTLLARWKESEGQNKRSV